MGSTTPEDRSARKGPAQDRSSESHSDELHDPRFAKLIGIAAQYGYIIECHSTVWTVECVEDEVGSPLVINLGQYDKAPAGSAMTLYGALQDYLVSDIAKRRGRYAADRAAGRLQAGNPFVPFVLPTEDEAPSVLIASQGPPEPPSWRPGAWCGDASIGAYNDVRYSTPAWMKAG